MSRFRTAVLAAATAASLLPALAAAQTPPDGGMQPRDEARRERPAQSAGSPQARPEAQAAPQARPNAGGGGERPDRGAPNGPGGERGRGDPNANRFAPGGERGDPGRNDRYRGGPNGPGAQGGYAGRGDPGANRWGPNAPGGQGGYAGRGPNGGDPVRGDDRRGDRWGQNGPGDGRGFDGRGPGGDPRFGRPGGGAPGFAGWRNDRRYDWQGWRDRNRGLFHGPRYFAPRGYGYRPFTVGYRLDPFFYDRSYWIADPYAYRLPPAEGPYRWVRYFNDVLLVDLRSGTVVDAIRDFFW